MERHLESSPGCRARNDTRQVVKLLERHLKSSPGLLRYFPAISQPEGLPLKVKDANGKDWVFQFRFWPNNNSRMHVWEGVTPCIQAMQLHAGDTVTFSRMDPKGTLIMGFRKASGASNEQDSQTLKSGNDFSSPPEADCKITAKHLKGSVETRNLASTGTSRRKGGNLGSKNKRLRIDNEDSMELKLIWEEAQQLLCPSPNCVPDIVLVEGHEFEEYEVEQLTAKPYYIELIIPELQLTLVSKLLWINKLLTEYAWITVMLESKNSQWAQCEDCSKWWVHSFHLDGPVLTIHGILKGDLGCSSSQTRSLDDNFAGAYYNSSDLPAKEDGVEYMMSSCSAAQELSLAQMAELIPCKTGPSKRVKAETHIEVSDGLDTLANLAILGEGETLPPPTTKHPRHRPGCTCIVCIQPPSGKGPKHKQTCTCNVCLTVKRRFRALMLRRKKHKSEKDAETSVKHQKKQPNLLLEKTQVGNKPSKTSTLVVNNSPTKPISKEGTSDVALESKRLSPQIDLNIQPEREEEPSPKFENGNMMSLLANTTT
ncbi:hypothetical protein ZIOFF_034643 [Zingiber officinale]|uniref:TF-B3 domain-containing protein n=1 Tax=Zingiber officinale TaxID=94328 RepID=A0A8J5GSN2_ZINOF|nr:hypothetical protein ZIOFF_034643 [Zingiber officinale]